VLAIRMQRTGRSGHPQFRVIVQDSRFSPSGGRVVAYLGSYNPHTKEAKLDSEKAAMYLQNGAQPSDTVAHLLKKEGIKLPSWVKFDEPQKRSTRNPDKRRSTRPAEPKEEPAPSLDNAAAPEEITATDQPAESPASEEEVPAPPTVDEPAPPEAPAEPVAEESIEKPVQEANS
jgi:small subunit ribosomal protein S16